MGRERIVGRVLATWAACALLVACTVEIVEKQKTTTDATEPPAPSTDEDPNAAAPPATSSGQASSSGGTKKDAGASSSSGGKDGGPDTGASSSGGSSGGPFDQFQLRNLADINAYRATKGIAPITLDVKMSGFAYVGSQQLAQNHTPHGHFIAAGNDGSIWTYGFSGSAGENQGDPHGWTKLSNDPVANEMLQIDAIQKAMFDEGPGPGEPHGHYTNMMNPAYKRVGVGLLMVSGSLYLTNDFSE